MGSMKCAQRKTGFVWGRSAHARAASTRLRRHPLRFVARDDRIGEVLIVE